MRVWRICRAAYAATAFNGDGAHLYGGRWNPVGVSVAYSSSSLSLALVEVFVNLVRVEVPDDLVSIAAELPTEETLADAAKEAFLAGLPKDWRQLDNPATQEVGAAWVRSGSTLALPVPSVAVDGEWNVLINPAHPDAASIRIERPKPFRFDPRMFKSR